MRDFMLLGLISLGFIWMVFVGINLEERQYCIKQLEMALKYPNFYITPWQKQMCDVRGIDLSAVNLVEMSLIKNQYETR